MKYMYDYHMHSTISIDGRSTMMELCQSAVDRGLAEIAITDHFEPTNGDGNCEMYNPRQYFRELRKARERFDGILKIKAGVELGQPHHFPRSSQNLLGSYSYDYVIGSAHKLTDGTDVWEMDYSSIKMDDLCEIYIKELKMLALWGRFDCIGHMDLIKRYGAGSYNTRITLMSKHEMLKEVFRIIITGGKGIEINTSGLRQTPKETMPGLDVLRLYKDMGGEILTIGSDAHYSKDVAKGVEDALYLALEAGFRYVTVFDNRQPSWERICIKPAVHSVPSIINIA